MPSAQDAKQFDEDDKARWKGFRTDVVDLLQSCYILLGINLFRDFAQLSLQCLEKSDWIPLEATMFCLNALSDSVADEPSVDQSLSLFFGKWDYRKAPHDELFHKAQSQFLATYLSTVFNVCSTKAARIDYLCSLLLLACLKPTSLTWPITYRCESSFLHNVTKFP